MSKTRFLYIPIPENKATIIFSMMNGNKAQMLGEELIKSELLRSASLRRKDSKISEAENSQIRSRLAREWDDWLHWWNDKERKAFFHIDTQLGWLLPLVANAEKVSFEDFRKKVLQINDVRAAKMVFKRIRLLQKSIEDAYNDAKTYNAIGAILHYRSDYSRRFTFLRWYFNLVATEDKDTVEAELTRYYDWAMLDLNHEEITAKNIEKFKEKRDEFKERLEDNQLYRFYYETAARWLLKANLLEDSSQESGKGRKFDFKIWRERSLEHIYPKSKVAHKEDDLILSWEDKILTDTSKITLWRHDIKFIPEKSNEEYYGSENCIGNLVLLYKNENSCFLADDFNEKKKTYFKEVGNSMFKSRHLIHTISVFAESKWTGYEIAKHKKEEIDKFDKQYSIYG